MRVQYLATTPAILKRIFCLTGKKAYDICNIKRAIVTLRVTLILPLTHGQSTLERRSGRYPSYLPNNILLDRMGRPEEVVDVVIHTVSRPTEWIGGEGLGADEGASRFEK